MTPADLYTFSFDTNTWSLVSNNVPDWSPVAFISAAYLTVTSQVYIWAGTTTTWDRPLQMLAIAADGSTTITNPTVAIDSYSVSAFADTVLYYGGHYDQYYATLYEFQVTTLLHLSSQLS